MKKKYFTTFNIKLSKLKLSNIKLRLMLLMLLTLSSLLMACNNIPRDNPEKLVIYYFWEENCINCDEITIFLNEIKNNYSNIEIKNFDFSKNENKKLLNELAEAYEERIITTPVIFIDEQVFIGFGSIQSTGKLIENKIISCQNKKCKNPADFLKK